MEHMLTRPVTLNISNEIGPGVVRVENVLTIGEDCDENFSHDILPHLV